MSFGLMEVWFVLLTLISLGFSGLVAVGIITYIRRTLQVMGRERDGSPVDRMLDELDRVQIQLEAANERLRRLERGMLDVRGELPPGESGAPESEEDPSDPPGPGRGEARE